MDKEKMSQTLIALDAEARQKRERAEHQAEESRLKAQLRAQAQIDGSECTRRYTEMLTAYRTFCRAIGDTSVSVSPSVVLKSDVDLPEIGRGSLIAAVVGYNNQNRPVYLEYAGAMRVTFSLQKSDGEVVTLDPEHLEANMANSDTVGPILDEPGRWTETGVIQARTLLDIMLPESEKTLEWLTVAASDPELNPRLAERMHNAGLPVES